MRILVIDENALRASILEEGLREAGYRDITVVRTGFKLDGQAPDVATPPPTLGAHNAEVFGALGVSEDELAKLQSHGAS